jgi:hypothetical protein
VVLLVNGVKLTDNLNHVWDQGSDEVHALFTEVRRRIQEGGEVVGVYRLYHGVGSSFGYPRTEGHRPPILVAAGVFGLQNRLAVSQYHLRIISRYRGPNPSSSFTALVVYHVVMS